MSIFHQAGVCKCILKEGFWRYGAYKLIDYYDCIALVVYGRRVSCKVMCHEQDDANGYIFFFDIEQYEDAEGVDRYGLQDFLTTETTDDNRLDSLTLSGGVACVQLDKSGSVTHEAEAEGFWIDVKRDGSMTFHDGRAECSGLCAGSLMGPL